MSRIREQNLLVYFCHFRNWKFYEAIDMNFTEKISIENIFQKSFLVNGICCFRSNAGKHLKTTAVLAQCYFEIWHAHGIDIIWKNIVV